MQAGGRRFDPVWLHQTPFGFAGRLVRFVRPRAEGAAGGRAGSTKLRLVLASRLVRFIRPRAEGAAGGRAGSTDFQRLGRSVLRPRNKFRRPRFDRGARVI